MNIHAIILAAGNSSRMGKAKIDLPVGDESLLKHCVQQALGAPLTSVVVVEGAYPIHTIPDRRAVVIKNNAWESGIGSSIKAGLSYVENHFPKTDAVVFLVADQPFVTSDHIARVITAFETTGSISASYYNESPGVPALFPRSVFPQILSISDQHGAKVILERNRAHLSLIEFPEGAIDLDTPEDYQEFLKRIP